MVIAKEKVLSAYLVWALMALTISACLAMLRESGNGGELANYAILGTFIIWVGFIIPVLRTGYKIARPSSTILLFNLYFLWSVFITAMQPQPGLKPTTYVVNIVWMALPLLVTDVVYYFTLYRGKTKVILVMAVVIAALLLYTYYGYYDANNVFLNIHLGTSYYALYMLPLVLCVPSKVVRMALIALISLAVISSVKRGGVLALLAALLAYIIIQQSALSRHHVATKVFVSILIIAVLSGVLIFFASLNYNNILERFESIGQDGGSGRTVVWWETWRLISNQDIIGMLIGNGYNAVLPNSRLGMSAHNDYLEAWFDFGLIGAVLYLLSVLSLFHTNILAIRRKHPCSAAFSAMSSMVLILSLISHIGIYFWMNLVMMTNAFFIGWINHDHKFARQSA